MNILVSTVLSATLLVMGSTLANAQNSNKTNASPASTATVSVNPDVATKSDLRRAERTITKQLKQQKAERKADADRIAKQVNDLKQAEAQRAAESARQNAEAQQKAAHNAQVREYELIGGFAAGVIILLMFGFVIIAQIRKNHRAVVEIPELSENAKPQEVKAYAEATKQIGKTIDYPVCLERDNPLDPGKKIFVGRIMGKVHNAGTADEVYDFDGRKAVAKKRFSAAFATFEARQRKSQIHAVNE